MDLIGLLVGPTFHSSASAHWVRLDLLWSIHIIASGVSLILGFNVPADRRSRTTIALSIMGSMVLSGMLSCAS